ncbi:MAG: sigma-70 domain-containing protein [Faecalimonas umbilicata]
MQGGRLIELYLEKVVEAAKEMYHKEVFLGDLIQEGNVSLMLALDELESVEEAHGKIMEEVRAGMQMLIEEQTEVKRRDHTLLEKYTDLDDNIKKLKEETGRDVTIEEVSAFLDMPEEEINDILNLGEQ